MQLGGSSEAVQSERNGRGLTGRFALFLASCLSLAIASCTTPEIGGNSLGELTGPNDLDLRAKKAAKGINRGESPAPSSTGRKGYQFFAGTEQDLEAITRDPPPGVAEAAGKYTINVDKGDINEVSKLVLGDTLGLSYVVDPRVQGTITLATTRPISEREVLDAFEAALRLNGAGLVKTGGITKVVALQELLEGEIGAADLTPGKTSAGYGVSAIPLRYISVANMMQLIDSFITRSGTVRASNAGNLILVRGTAAERRSLVDVVLSFDVDWMRKQTASIAQLSNSTPEEMVRALKEVFAEDSALSGNNAVRVIPLERINSVVIVARNQAKVKRALDWVHRLDTESPDDTNYYVYAVQHGDTKSIAKILAATFVDKAGDAGPTAEVAPDVPTVQEGIGDAPAGDAAATDGKTDRQDVETASTTAADPPATEAPPDLSSGIRITPNTANNTLAIRATPREYGKMLAMLRRIDQPAVQVLINTTIAEVQLNDNLRYGVQAYFKDNDVSGGIFNGNSLTLRPSFPGLNFLLGSTNDPRLVIDALAAVTKVRIVSSPSILVLENEPATIKVGDQVPIRTQTLDKGADGTVNSFEYRDTGVILKVKPRVNSSGLVTMELGQELSSVAQGSGSSAAERENPTFSQRSITSKVSVQSTQTVVLGGLISGQDSRQRESVPLINKIPLLGDLVGKTDNGGKRTELIVFITPQIVKNGEDASRASEELRARMQLFNQN